MSANAAAEPGLRTGPASEAAIEESVRREQAQMAFDRSAPSNFVGPPLALLVGWTLWGAVDTGLLVAWVVGRWGVAAWRFEIARRHRRDGPTRTLHWIARYDWALFADGLLYGLLGSVLMPRGQPTLMTIMIATVVLAGVVGVLVGSARQRSALAFNLPLMVPTALALPFAMQGKMAFYVAVGLVVLLGVMLVEVRRAAEHTRNMLRLRFQMDDLAEQRRQALLLAEQSNAAKSQFLATMSHEVRTPLHGILGVTRMLQAEAAEGRRAGPPPGALPGSQADALLARRSERLRTIERSGEHLLAIINDVLDHSRIEGGQLRVDEAPFDLDELVREAVELQRGAAEEKGLRLARVVGGGGPCWVHGDAARVRQVLLNLLGNAVKFTERGAIEATYSHSSAGLATIEVIDTGPGVPVADRERIFEPFQQLDGSFSRRHGGTGLGLSISRQLVRAMRGDIACFDGPAGGSRFRVWLQLPPCEAPVSEAPVPVQAAPPVAPPEEVRGRHVLLVEDNPVNAMVAEAHLQWLGLKVTIVDDGLAAVAECAQRHFDLVFMDCQLPGLDGFEATRRIRADERQRGTAPLPIVALTANALAGDRERCLQAGMNDHLAKPFTQEEMQALVSRYARPAAV